jgi:hypothetical protein
MMGEEKLGIVGEENIQVFNIENILVYNTWKKKTRMGFRACLFNSPIVVEYNYGTLQYPFQALTNLLLNN